MSIKFLFSYRKCLGYRHCCPSCPWLLGPFLWLLTWAAYSCSFGCEFSATMRPYQNDSKRKCRRHPHPLFQGREMNNYFIHIFDTLLNNILPMHCLLDTGDLQANRPCALSHTMENPDHIGWALKEGNAEHVSIKSFADIQLRRIF
ncbi:hypothetical protein BC939DRAFT_202917 [Gamsiella multidivaricata]|uniref:uncharacterized protein n=1 Tax=Gamsiella multidivaricata TaxID=101098 RepID=UPI0022211141|nr:uncharacterized protein BC939DRAFT_202917 [Gamsiella multidivaricata]KAI7821749.1 hypothetical protein BC939DRAFT_202917 [Gamsiella multidivaricata]